MSDNFDNLTRRLASDMSRRSTLKILLGGAAAAIMGGIVRPIGASAQTATCSDNIKNGTETDVDCGGGACPPCAVGLNCNVGADCVSGVCTAGKCSSSCPAGTTLCNGSCVNTLSDPQNCGSCGFLCSFPNALSACNGGACIIQACNAGFANCDSNTANGCETNVASDNNNCGACGRICQAGTTCTNGTCAPPATVPEIPTPIVAPVVAAAALGGVWWHQRRRHTRRSDDAGGSATGAA